MFTLGITYDIYIYICVCVWRENRVYAHIMPYRLQTCPSLCQKCAMTIFVLAIQTYLSVTHSVVKLVCVVAPLCIIRPTRVGISSIYVPFVCSVALPLPNPLKPGVWSRMKMSLEQHRHMMLQLHLSDRNFVPTKVNSILEVLWCMLCTNGRPKMKSLVCEMRTNYGAVIRVLHCQ